MSVPVAATGGEAAAETTVVDAAVSRVLVYRLGSLGDTLVALPSLHLIARAFPNAERRMLTNIPVTSRAPAAAAVLGDSGLIHGYESYPVGTRQPWQLLKLLLRLRRFRPEVIVYLKATDDFAIAQRDSRFLRLTGAPRIVGLPGSPADLEPHTLPDGSFEHESARLARGIRALGSTDLSSTGAWDLSLNSQEQKRANAALEPVKAIPFFAVSVGTKVQSKDWGVRNWRSLLQALAQAFPAYGLVLAGAAEESGVTEEAAAAWRAVPHAGPTVNLCGRLSPRESAAAFQRARLFIGHDSGPMHLAGVVGTPVVAIFAARNRPRTWFPVSRQQHVLYHRVDCWGCGLETCTEQRKKCLLSITVQEVMQAVHACMAQNLRVVAHLSGEPSQVETVYAA